MKKFKIICIGDSLTEGDYGIFGERGVADVHSKNYPYYLERLLDAEVLNYGKCGLTPTTYLEFYKNEKPNVENADLVIIMLGTNGGLDDETDTQGNADFDELINLIKEDAPCAKIALCTPPHATTNSKMSNFGFYDKVDKAVKFVRKYSKEKQLECIDLATCKLLNDQNEPIMQPNDGLHFTEVGYGVIALFIRDAIINLFNC